MAIADDIKKSIEKSSWIRKMFEEGARLKNLHGPENVYDFSLGNPDLDPPKKFYTQLKKAIKYQKGIHGYMPNAGFDEVKESIAQKVSREHNVNITGKNVVMTCGAAGGLNTIFRTILDPGDEVILLTPYFVEYQFYIKNHNGSPVLVKTNEDFSINLENIENSITDRTRAILINSPNNPTGRVYNENEIKALSELLRMHSSDKRIIYLVSDEPYRDIVYDNITVPGILNMYENSIIVTSYSKTLSIPGERIGYIAVSPGCLNSEILLAGLVLSNRILGFVNAPAIMQRIVAGLNDVTVDIKTYQKRRDIFVNGLRDAGYDFIVPGGAFYIFCKSPIEDDVEFVRHLLKYNILVVPGSGFGGPGYFRIAYCVSEKTINKSLPGFKRAIEEF